MGLLDKILGRDDPVEVVTEEEQRTMSREFVRVVEKVEFVGGEVKTIKKDKVDGRVRTPDGEAYLDRGVIRSNSGSVVVETPHILTDLKPIRKGNRADLFGVVEPQRKVVISNVATTKTIERTEMVAEVDVQMDVDREKESGDTVCEYNIEKVGETRIREAEGQ